ncbi:hypothetical protein HW511_09175 [Asaia siamensis]|uniref:Uncharacterized protein n=1 Tax=Asaia siamensis TaxID=110479 RepID=A0ABQ1LXH5_9PROT|nr:hypothetical protein [Asaia siamensis]GBR02831.1 hypothetical protein AA0323_0104 [Asaia siamensis NRIC 0323]GGC30776.1 hypothetical protein GCM10007207_15360 [Asaia siamensis]
MTTRIRYVDSSKATNEISFIRKDRWKGVSDQAADWIREFYDKNYLDISNIKLFIPHICGVKDTKLNRFFIEKQKRFLPPELREGCVTLHRKIFSKEGKLYYWAVISTSDDLLGAAIDICRDQRSLIIFDSNDCDNWIYAIDKICEDSLETWLNIDSEDTMEMLLSRGLKVWRVRGAFDDEDLTVQLY